MLHIVQMTEHIVVKMENTAVFNANSHINLKLRLNILGVIIAVIDIIKIGEYATTVS